MKIGVIIYSTDPEVVFNALRLSIFSLRKGDKVSIFLLAKGVEYESLNSSQFNIIELAREIVSLKGNIFACGTCLNLREKSSSYLCPKSSLEDLYNIIKESDKIISF